MIAVDKGWITIHRQLQENWLWKKKPFSIGQAWIDILMECNHEENKVSIGFKLFNVKRGETLKSLKTWSKRFGWTISATRRFFKMLEKDAMIRTANETVTTRITVCNYSIYQSRRNASETQVKRKRNASETQGDTDNNDNNETIKTIYLYWNSFKIIKHGKLTTKIKNKIGITLKDYSEQQIKTSINNYSIIVKDEQYFFQYKWTLKDFLQRGIDKFLDLQTAKDNYKSKPIPKSDNRGVSRTHAPISEERKKEYDKL